MHASHASGTYIYRKMPVIQPLPQLLISLPRCSPIRAVILGMQLRVFPRDKCPAYDLLPSRTVGGERGDYAPYSVGEPRFDPLLKEEEGVLAR
jgi:hypothetical protein